LPTGIDISPSAGQLAESWLKEKGLDGKVFVGNYKTELRNFQDNTFDGAIAINSLHHLQDKEELHEIYFEIGRVCKRQSTLFLVIPSKSTEILEPDVERLFFSDSEIKDITEKYFELMDIYQDDQNAWVIIAKNKKLS
jgi:ubiquinone/menaquinone biosynthesis C-methylase UbiE